MWDLRKPSQSSGNTNLNNHTTSKRADSAAAILNIGLSNVSSLMSKVPLVMSFLMDYKVHILSVTKSHLLPSTPSSFVKVPGYNLFRNDVSGSHAKQGVCMYVHDSIKVDKVDTLCSNILTLCLPEYKVHVVTVYRRPSKQRLKIKLC